MSYYAVDCYRDRPQHIVGPFDTEAAAWAWAIEQVEIGRWGVEEAMTPEQHAKEFPDD